jgi:hypothetical protein
VQENGVLHMRDKSIFTDELQLLDYSSAEKFLGMKGDGVALRNLVFKCRGPRATKIGRRTFFTLLDLREFVTRCREPLKPVPVPAMSAPRRQGRPSVADRQAALAASEGGAP